MYGVWLGKIQPFWTSTLQDFATRCIVQATLSPIWQQISGWRMLPLWFQGIDDCPPTKAVRRRHNIVRLATIHQLKRQGSSWSDPSTTRVISSPLPDPYYPTQGYVG